MDKTYYLNPLFDLDLGNYDTVSVKRSASEMSVLFLPCCMQNDSLLIDVEISSSYLDYLKSFGFALPHIIQEDTEKSKQSEGIAWGWTEQSIRRLSLTGAQCRCPSLDVVKKVNNRKFCNEIGLQYQFGVPGSVYCQNSDELLKAIKTLKDNYPLVIKPAFGGSGFGFKKIYSEDDIQKLADTTKMTFDHGGIVIEPWCKRSYDLSTNLKLNSDGTIEYVRHQRLVSDEHGSFVGIYIGQNDPVLNKWIDKLESAATLVANLMYEAGYFGVAGFDSFVYKNKNDKETLAPIIEINGRHVMSHVAHSIRNQIAHDKYTFYRMVSRKRLRLPETYDEFDKILKRYEINNCVLISPLRVKHESVWVQPSKATIFIFADNEEQLFNSDNRLRKMIDGKSV